MSLRFELSVLVHAFKKDVKDPERTGIHEDNIGYYYTKYFRKSLSPAFFGLKTVRELLALVSDCIAISDKKVLHTALPATMESLNVFVLLTEEDRRDRARRVDLGEEGATIKMQTSTLLSGGGVQGVSPSPGVAALLQAQREKLAQAGTAAVRPAGVQTVQPTAGLRPTLQPVRPQGPQTPGAWRAPQPAWGQTARPPTPSWAQQQTVRPGAPAWAQQRPSFGPATIRPAWRG